MAPSVAGKFPSISHPLSRLGSREALSINGRSRDGAQSVDWSFKTPSPLPIRSHSVAGSILTERTSTSLDGGRKLSTTEIIATVEDKLRANNCHAVRKLFRSNDPNGEGKVTKEAFCRILWHLCGYLTTRQISHVLKRLSLDKKSSISFEDLVSCFRRSVSQGGACEQEKNSKFFHPPFSAPDRLHERSTSSTPQPSKFHLLASESLANEAEQSWGELKKLAATGEVDFRDLLPPMCFGVGAYVIPGQLRECLTKLNIPSSDAICAKIFRSKFEGGSPYAVRSKKFFHLLGLDDNGRLVAMETGVKETPRPSTRSSKSSVSTPKPRPVTSQSHDVPTKTRDPTPIMTSRPKTSLDMTKFDGNIGEFVGKKLEESQGSFIKALESKENNGFLTKPDFRGILGAMGIRLKATDLEHFLARNGLRRPDGLINSRLLIRRLKSRSTRGLLNKVMRDQDHLFHATTPPQTPAEGGSALHLETKMIEMFQRDFLALLSSFRQLDSNGTGLLTVEEFRTALEFKFSTRFTDEAWDTFMTSQYVRLVAPPSNATQGQLGYIAYNDFLAKYDVMLRPSTADEDDPWKQDDEDVAALREHKDRYLKSMDVDPKNHTHRHEPRPLEQLEATLVDVFVYKFHNFKKEYDIIVREDFCRVDKEKFDFILFRCGFVLTPSELSRLWLSMPITRPMESLSIPTILQHVMRLYYSAVYPGKFSKTSRDSSIVTHVLEKIREPVVQHWGVLKKKLRFLDPMGTSRIPKEDIISILRGLRPNILDMELLYLVEMLESRVPGKTNYFRLMEFYAKNPKRKDPAAGDREPLLSSDSMRYNTSDPVKDFNRPRQHNYRHPTPAKPEFITLRNAPSTSPFKRVTMHQTVTKPRKLKPGEKIIEANKDSRSSYPYRGNYVALQRHPPSTAPSKSSENTLVEKHVKPHVGARDLPALTRALRKEDIDDVGKISVDAFMRILSSYGIHFKDNDLYKLLSRYDRNMRENISYERFLKSLA